MTKTKVSGHRGATAAIAFVGGVTYALSIVVLQRRS